MNRFEKRKFKRNVYKHGNTIMYIGIFVMASIITIAAAANRTDRVAYIDESQIASSGKESVAIKNSQANKVAASENSVTDIETTTTPKTVQPQTTKDDTNMTTQAKTEPVSGEKVKITADTLKVRDKASQDGNMIGMVDIDDVFEVISQNGNWIEINYNGTKGYISAEFTEIVE